MSQRSLLGLRGFGAAAFLAVWGACATSPTGRSQVLMMSDDRMNEMGGQAFDDLKRKQRTETDVKINSYVKCVASAVARQARDTTGVAQWETVVFRDESANAFALPGGKIGVHTGILRVAKTPDQLAAVLGHEVGHVIARHGNERITHAMGAQLGLVLADQFMGEAQYKQHVMMGLGIGSTLGVLAYSRTHESEADILGQDLMADAGFKPSEAIELWKNMAVAGGRGLNIEFLSTHPSHETRVEDLQGHLPEADRKWKAALSAGRKPNC